ncbi:hypothetical protein ABIB57_003658 [Devosia sp. UYZn731]|uniref:Arc family DNA-binding protein n=1 Tax=Devosia sp. UYZn731 TaxID=3156345 RepID=UPI0033923E38
MRDSNTTAETEYRGQVRMPTPLADRVKAAAITERRSMNSQIIVLLERALPENEKAEAAVSAATPA